MGTVTFSARVSEDKLATANQLAQRQFGMSFGQYCGTILLELVCDQNAFPVLGAPQDDKKRAAFSRMKSFSERCHNASVATLSDDQIREMIAGRYA